MVVDGVENNGADLFDDDDDGVENSFGKLELDDFSFNGVNT